MRDYAPGLLESICTLHITDSHDYSSRYTKKMKQIILLILSFVTCIGQLEANPKITISDQPDWVDEFLHDVTFTAQVKENKELLGSHADSGNGFIVFSCTAKKNLKGTLLWIDAELTFSNGFKRKFKSIQFHISQKGTEYDIIKVPFERSLSLGGKRIVNSKDLQVVDIYVTNIAIK